MLFKYKNVPDKLLHGATVWKQAYEFPNII